MKKILSFAFSFYQFWIIITVITLILIVPKTFLGIKDGYPAKIAGVKQGILHSPDTAYLYNQQKTVRMEATEYAVAFAAAPEVTYILIYKVFKVVLLIAIFFFLYKIFSSMRHKDPFVTKLDCWLKRIGFALLIMWLISNAFSMFMPWRLQKAGFENFNIYEQDGSYFLFAILAFAFAIIFKKGKEYKEENDLTV